MTWKPIQDYNAFRRDFFFSSAIFLVMISAGWSIQRLDAWILDAADFTNLIV
jgi:hypothetical protein